MSRVSKIDEEQWLDQYEAGDETARNKIILAYEQMVNALVEKALRKKENLEYVRNDLQQAGMLGLVKAFDKFDRKRGCRFSTYAYPYTKKEIYNIIRGEEEYLRRRESIENVLSEVDYMEVGAHHLVCEKALTWQDILNILEENLTQRELDVCKLLLADENMTNADISKILGITRERVRQLRKGLQSKVNLRLFLHSLVA